MAKEATVQASKETGERNYTIEFYRFMFAINFLVIHSLMIFPLGYLGYRLSAINTDYYLFESAFDTILPFMIFAGFFLMNHFKKLQAKGLNDGVSASRQAWTYLKQRLAGLLWIFLLAQFLGFIANGIWRGYEAAQWPVYFLASLGEFFGLQLTGIGMGNQFVGVWGDAAPVMQLLNTPMWFISGIFICGYFTYYLVAKHEKGYLGFALPLITLVYIGSCWATDTVPLWNTFITIGQLTINMDFILMFIGLGIGCQLWYAVNALKDKKWTKGAKIAMTIVQVIVTLLILFRTWVSVNHDFVKEYLDWGWGPTFILSVVFCFFILLDVDYCSRCPIFHSKIWNIPGKLSLYIYMIHFPVLIFTAMAFGLKGVQTTGDPVIPNVPGSGELLPEIKTKLYIVVAVTIVVSIILAYLLYLLDTKVIRPWLKKTPWFKKEENKEGQLALATAGVDTADEKVDVVEPAVVDAKEDEKKDAREAQNTEELPKAEVQSEEVQPEVKRRKRTTKPKEPTEAQETKEAKK